MSKVQYHSDNLIHPKHPHYRYFCSLDGGVCVEKECTIMKFPGCTYCDKDGVGNK